jgi:hypothetical protein
LLVLLFACLEYIYWENRAKEGGFNPPLYFFKKLYYNIYRKLKKGCDFYDEHYSCMVLFL